VHSGLASRNDLWKGKAAAQVFVSQLGSALIVAVGLAFLWELLGKRAFAREVLETARTSTDVHAAGLTRVGTRYLDDPDWDHYFQAVQKLDIFFAYGRTWRRVNWERLRRVASNSDCRIRVYLPDPSDHASVTLLAERFQQTPEQLREAIQEARHEFSELAKQGSAEVAVYYRPGDSAFSCYRFDGTAILTLYTHSRRRTDVPTLVCAAGGSLYDFIREELKSIHAQSRLVTEVSTSGDSNDR
jgi:hypothetical protein